MGKVRKIGCAGGAAHPPHTLFFGKLNNCYFEQPEQEVATQPPQDELPAMALTLPSAAIEKAIAAEIMRELCSLPQSGHSAEVSRWVMLRISSNWLRQSEQRYS